MKKTTVEGLPWPYDISKRQGLNSFTTFEAILAPNHVLMITVNAFPLRQQHLDISALIPQPASNDLDQSGVAVGVNDKDQLKSGAIFGVVAQYMRFDSNAHGQAWRTYHTGGIWRKLFQLVDPPGERISARTIVSVCQETLAGDHRSAWVQMSTSVRFTA